MIGTAMSETILRLKIQRDKKTRWERSTKNNADDALSDLAGRGLYDFEAGDTLKKVVQSEVDDEGNVRVA